MGGIGRKASQRRICDRVDGVGVRQPVHVVYGGAHLFKADTAARLGRIALASFEKFNAREAFDVEPSVMVSVASKLEREPVEDYRIDFEDGYGIRSDSEEDDHARAAARAVAAGGVANSLPPFIGIRIKPLNHESRGRSLRTLELFLRGCQYLPSSQLL